MATYRVKLSAVGEATVEVEADNDHDAIEKAYERIVGVTVDGGAVQWELEDVEQVQPA